MTFELYIPSKGEVNDFKRYFELQSRQSGFGGFEGIQFQRGTGLGAAFGSLLRTVAPVAKTVLKRAGKAALKETGHAVGEALSEMVKPKNRSQRRQKRQNGPGVPRPRRRTNQKGRGVGMRVGGLPGVKSIKGGRKVIPRKRKNVGRGRRRKTQQKTALD